VSSYDRRADVQGRALKNLRGVGLEDRVALKLRDIAHGFDGTGVDALFLDLPDPQTYLLQARRALRSGGCFGCILPTTNQVAAVLEALDANGFAFQEVCEILLRFYKVIPQRLRPTDRMVAHTGYLVFARPVLTPPPVQPTGDNDVLTAAQPVDDPRGPD